MNNSLFACSVRVIAVNRVVFLYNTISHDATSFKSLLVYKSICFATDSGACFARNTATPKIRVSPRSKDVWGGNGRRLDT